MRRSIYYQDPELFKGQSIVNHLVDDLAYTLGVGRNALNIVRIPLSPLGDITCASLTISG